MYCRNMNNGGNNIISASGVREAIKKDNLDEIKNTAPECLINFLVVKIVLNIIKIYLFSLFNYIFIFINII